MTDPPESMLALCEDTDDPLSHGWQRGKQDAGLGSGTRRSPPITAEPLAARARILARFGPRFRVGRDASDARFIPLEMNCISPLAIHVALGLLDIFKSASAPSTARDR
jgi:hypothetical protein